LSYGRKRKKRSDTTVPPEGKDVGENWPTAAAVVAG